MDLQPPLQVALTSLELGGNRLRSLENLGDLPNLEELWVGKNKISKIEVRHVVQRGVRRQPE